MIGNVIDKYEVLQKLGEGATSTVYRGRHMSIGRDVAIKILHPHLSASTRYRERFNREARAVGRLSHENIVSILDYSGQSAEECYIVTELVEGATLQSLLEQHGPITSEILCLLGIELCQALGFAHAAGVIHRDIKPENVMIRRDGRVKLMDFGVARVLDEGQITLDGSLLGSPAYMSPQQALDEKLDGRSDLFSLGTVLFHAVTGTVPFSGSNASVILRNIIDGQRMEVLAVNPAAAPGLAGVIDRCLQPRPEDRYPDAAAVGAALTEVLAESAVPLDHPVINLRNWLVNPRDTNAALTAHLQDHLLARGKACLADNDAVGALQLFNRLLAIDEDHPEVLALIQGLHGPGPRSRRAGLRAAAAAGALLLAGALAWFFYPGADTTRGQAPVSAVPTAVPAGPVEGAPAAVTPPEPSFPQPAPNTAVTSSPTLGSGAAPSGADAGNAPRHGSSPSTATSDPAKSRLARMVEASAAQEPPATERVDTAPATVTLELTKPAEVWVDGTRVGAFRVGPAAEWVGTRQRPIELTPGTHTLELRNAGAEKFSESITLGPGEARHVRAELRERPTPFIVHAGIPRDCTMTVGSTPYGTVAGVDGQIKLTGPDPATPVKFDCPGKGSFTMPLGPSLAGKERFLPEQLPEGLQ